MFASADDGTDPRRRRISAGGIPGFTLGIGNQDMGPGFTSRNQDTGPDYVQKERRAQKNGVGTYFRCQKLHSVQTGLNPQPAV